MSATVTVPPPAASIRRITVIGHSNRYRIELSNGRSFECENFLNAIDAREEMRLQPFRIKDSEMFEGVSDSAAHVLWKRHLENLNAAELPLGRVVHDEAKPEPERTFEVVMEENFEIGGMVRKGTTIATIHVPAGGVSDYALRNILVNLTRGVCVLKAVTA